jgi:5-methylthioadenosine/S-adenosylhomocysteine deaminase
MHPRGSGKQVIDSGHTRAPIPQDVVPARILRCAELLADAVLEPVVDAGLVVAADGSVAASGPWAHVREAWPDLPYEDRRPLIAIPGLIDAHSHGRALPLSASGLVGAPLERFILRLAAATALPPADDALVAATDLLCTGVTTVQSIVHTTQPRARYDEQARAVAGALRSSGIRFELVLGFTDIDGVLPAPVAIDDVPDAEAREMLAPKQLLSGQDYLAVFDALSGERIGAADEHRARITMGPVAPQWAGQPVWPEILTRAQGGARVHVHLLESRHQRPPWLLHHPLRQLADVGLPAGSLSAAHAIWLEAQDIAWLAERRFSVVHNPASNQRLKSGTAPVRELLDHGVPVAFGIDSNAAQDPPDAFCDLRVARAAAIARNAPLTARELFAMATSGGAAATGRSGDLGAVRIGARADILLLDPEWRAAADDAVEALIGRAERDHVDTVVVGGRDVVSGGRASAAAQAVAARRRLEEALSRDEAARRRRLEALQRVEGWVLERWGTTATETGV